MPRKISGLGGGTRVPIRGIANLLNNLPAEAAEALRGAFADAEDLLGYYDQSVRDKQNKRKLSGLLDSPILVVSQSILGASVKFDRLDDPRISFYELQVDDVNTFPNPESFQIVDPFFAIDGISTIKHIRARGVRGVTGECGNWSNTVTARPTLTAPRAHSWQFYQRYSGAEPNLFKKVRYSGEDTPNFYTLFETSFYANRLVGGMSVWGMVSNRLKKPLDSRFRPWDRVKFEINGLTRMENYFPLWTNSFFDDDTPNVNPVNGRPMSFYGLGGYTAGFGPYNIPVPVSFLERGQGPMDPTAYDDIDAPGCLFYWADEALITRPSRLDTGQLDSFDDIANKGREAVAGVATNTNTSYLVAKKFKFKIPADEDVHGIEVKVKRRQLNYPVVPRELLPLQHENKRSVTPELQFDYGYASNKRLLESNFNQGSLTTPAVPTSDIVKDTEYGRFVILRGDVNDTNLDYLATAGRGVGLPAIPPQVGTIDAFNTFIGSNHWTVSTWVNPFSATQGDNIEGIWTYVGYSNAGGSGDRLIRLFRGNANAQRLTLEGSGFGIRTQTYDNVFTASNRWYHLTVRYSGGADWEVYVDGSLKIPTTTSGPAFPGFTAANATFGGFFSYYSNTAFVSGFGILNGGFGQTGLWNVALGVEEIRTLTEMRMNFDYRFDFDRYEHAANLQHYWLYLPEEPQIQDMEVLLHDASGVRFDLDNKAVTELWPRLDEFFYQVNFSPEGQLLASSQGIPHDNVIGIGYQTYGGASDTWGGTFTKADYESPEFGVAVRAMNPDRAFPGVAYVDHIKMALYTSKPGDNSIRVTVKAEATNQFYIEREVFGGLFNAIETGEIPL